MTLLRARCAVVWCVDAYAGRKHLSRQLAPVVRLAEEELDVTIEIDVGRFALLPGSDHVVGHSFAIGRIRYPGSDVEGTLIVVKSGLSPTTPKPLHDYRRLDRAFPYHSTAVQWYGPQRFRQYRALGHHHGNQAVDAVVA